MRPVVSRENVIFRLFLAGRRGGVASCFTLFKRQNVLINIFSGIKKRFFFYGDVKKCKTALTVHLKLPKLCFVHFMFHMKHRTAEEI